MLALAQEEKVFEGYEPHSTSLKRQKCLGPGKRRPRPCADHYTRTGHDKLIRASLDVGIFAISKSRRPLTNRSS